MIKIEDHILESLAVHMLPLMEIVGRMEMMENLNAIMIIVIMEILYSSLYYRNSLYCSWRSVGVGVADDFCLIPLGAAAESSTIFIFG